MEVGSAPEGAPLPGQGRQPSRSILGPSPPGEFRGRRSSLGMAGRERANTESPTSIALDRVQGVLTEEQATESISLEKSPTANTLLEGSGDEGVSPDSVRQISAAPPAAPRCRPHLLFLSAALPHR